MNNDKFQTIVKENKYEELFKPNQIFSCQYYTEDEFIIKNRNGDDFLNIFSLNMRSLPKRIESDKTTSIYNVSTRVLSKK